MGLILAFPLSGCIDFTCGRTSSDSYLAGVAQNSFPSCFVLAWDSYVLAWDSCTGCCHCTRLVKRLHHTWVLFFVAQVCGSAGPPIC
jgi:hypothetical protein